MAPYRACVRALTFGGADAGCYLNTGEGGGVSPYHLEGRVRRRLFNRHRPNFGARNEDGTLNGEKLRQNLRKTRIIPK